MSKTIKTKTVKATIKRKALTIGIKTELPSDSGVEVLFGIAQGMVEDGAGLMSIDEVRHGSFSPSEIVQSGALTASEVETVAALLTKAADAIGVSLYE
mgnify:CR=1 FL=1|tara:strand:+ start:8880 stop:9173 length:294 start_codon:yes stop_codon:yes gene_type:complete